MANKAQRAFAKLVGIRVDFIVRLALMIDKRGTWATHECNGDPHISVDNDSDKNACSHAWEKDVLALDRRILALAKSAGFDDVDFGVGLYPTLQKGGYTYHIPFAN